MSETDSKQCFHRGGLVGKNVTAFYSHAIMIAIAFRNNPAWRCLAVFFLLISMIMYRSLIYYTTTTTTTIWRPYGLCLGLTKWASTRKVNQSGFTGARNNEWQWYAIVWFNTTPTYYRTRGWIFTGDKAVKKKRWSTGRYAILFLGPDR